MQNFLTMNSFPEKKTSVALGVFDGVHIGHQRVINTAVSFKNSGYSPAVFTLSMNSVGYKHKGENKLLLTENQKNNMLEAMGIEYICSPAFEDIKNLSPEDFVLKILLEKLNAGIAVCGKNFHFGYGAKAGANELKNICNSFGIDTVIVPYECKDNNIISSSYIKECILKGDIALANSMLGYDLFYDGIVEHGKEIGRTLSFPTINQRIPSELEIPRFGVYASITEIDGRQYASVSNIGIKPTIGNQPVPLCETYINGINTYLYGKNVKVRIKQFLRPEQKFSGLDELKKQISADVESAFKYLNTINF